jgi:DNA-binding phage protein
LFKEQLEFADKVLAKGRESVNRALVAYVSLSIMKADTTEIAQLLAEVQKDRDDALIAKARLVVQRDTLAILSGDMSLIER